MANTNEKALIAALKSGDADGLSGSIDAYSGYLYAICSRILQGAASREDVEECVADAIVSIWKNAGSIDENGEGFKGFIGAIARNRAIDLRRKLTRAEFLPLNEDILSGAADVPQQIISIEERRQVQRAVLTFDQPDRDIFIRRYYFGEPLKAIAAAFGLSERAVEGRLHRGRLRLKQWLGGEENG